MFRKKKNTHLIFHGTDNKQKIELFAPDHSMKLLPKWFAKPFAKPYVAGETIEEVTAEIKSLNDEVKHLKNGIISITSTDTLNDINTDLKIKKNMDDLLDVNNFDKSIDSIDIIENYNPGEEIVNNTRGNDDDTTKDIPIKTITMNELYNISLSSDSDNDLCLNKEDIEYIQNKKLEELGAKMEKLYMELQNKKQTIEYMRSKYVNLERSYQVERLKKTNIWEIMHSYFK